MISNLDSGLRSASGTTSTAINYSSYILGAAVFDLNGLPKEYLMSGENSNISWVQTIFQALGLRSLLTSSLKLEGFHYAVIHGDGCEAIVVKQRTQYTAFLLQIGSAEVMGPQFLEWIHAFDLGLLRSNPRFHAA